MMRKSALPLLVAATILLTQVCGQQTVKQQLCARDQGHEAIIQPDADAFIAGFFSMHQQSETGTCGSVAPAEMQSYEAIRWALDRLNKKDEYLNGEDLIDYYIPGVRIGMIARDYCSNPHTAIGMAQELFPQFSAEANDCTKNTNQLMLGLIGASSSDDVKVLEKFAETNNLPLVSYQNTAPELSDTQQFPNFMRTVPPDGPLTNSIVKVIGELDWNYVVVVYTDNSYGRGAYRTIRPQLNKAGICLTSAISVDPHDTSDATVDDIFKEIMQTNTTGVIYLGSNSIIEAILRRGELYPNAGMLQWVVTDSVALSDTFPGQNYPKGLITVVPASRKIIEFEDHWVRIDEKNPSFENPWYKAMYMERFSCRLPGMTSQYTTECENQTEASRRNQYVQDQFVESAVHAVYTYAHALKLAHADLCGGVAGMCQQLRSLSTSDFYQNYMRNIDFTYGKAERVESLASVSLDPYNAAARVNYNGNDIINPSFEMYSFNDYQLQISFKFKNFGSHINGLLEIIQSRLIFYNEPRTERLSYIPKSVCPSSPCSPCLGAIMDPKYVYIPGDVVINSVFSVHNYGNSMVTCGDLYDSPNEGIQAMQMFIFAVEHVKTNLKASYNILRGVDLGALGFDDCMSPVLSNQQITEVQQYSRKITDQDGNNMLDPRTVEAFMGGRSPYQAVAMADLMNSLKRPMMGVETYTATLNDDDLYPHFVRSQFDFNVLAKAIVNVAKRNGWRYMQTVHHADMFGVEFNNVLRKVAAEEGICIVASYASETQDAKSIVTKLKSRENVKPVVLLLLHEQFRSFLQGVKDKGAANDFQLISVTGNSMRSVSGFEDQVNGMISLKLWSPLLDEFQAYLKQIDVRTYMTNPWMMEWYENFYDCKFNPTGSQTACGNKNMFADNDFELNTNMVTVMYGVYAIAFGLDDTLKHYCGTGYNGVCGNFLNAADKGERLLQNILTATSYVDEGNTYRFLDRMGNIPFKYYNFNSFLNIYNEIGEFKPAEDYLYLENYALTADRKPEEVTSSCPGVCMECLYLFRYQKFMYIPGDILIPGIFDVHYRGDSPYSCSGIRNVNGFQYTEAFAYALEQINSDKAAVKLNGVRLGGVGFDGCTDPIRASALVTGIYSGAFPKPDTNLDSVNLNINDLMGWLSYDSESTINVATILQRFGIPAVSPGATTPVLDDKITYNTFFRTVPSDSRVAEAMAKLSRKLDFDYIITLNAPEEGSREGVQKFRQYAEEQDICIGASYEFGTDGNAKQIMRYILQSTTKVVAVFASPDRYIEELLQEKASNPDAYNLIFITNQPWSIPVGNSRHNPVATISFMMDGNVDYQAFRLFLANQIPRIDHRNPWLREYYESVYGCNLAGSYKYNKACLDPTVQPLNADNLIQDIGVLPTINAVYALAEGIHRTLEEKCGVGYYGTCPEFFSDEYRYDMIMDHMDGMNFSDVNNELFKFIEREVDRNIIFKRFLSDGTENYEGKFKDDGEFEIPLEVTLKTIYRDIPAQCVGQCVQCNRDSSGEEEFMYIAGDIHIAALFDIHKEGSTPYTCGDINDRHGFQLMEAFNWALEYVNDRKGIFEGKLPGVKLGSLIFDTCSSPVRAGNLVANYHARNFEIRTTDYRIDPSLIDLYVGPLTSEASIRVADVLSELGIPQISYGASSLELRSQRKYRYFLRTVPADDKQARALISFLKKYELKNIQLISQFSSVGEFGRNEFMRLAPLNEICVSAEFVIGQDGLVTSEEARDVITKLRNKPHAKVVVLIMDDPYTVLTEANSFSYIVDEFAFIGTDKWGFGIAGYENLAGLDNLISNHKVVTLDVESADFPDLDKYLEEKVPANYTDNPWFRDYYEYMYNCSATTSNARYPKVCGEYLQGYSRADTYIQDPYALYVINAVWSAALGIHETLWQWCGQDQYYGFCNILRTNGERREYFLDNIKKVSFTDQTDQPFYFTGHGESDRGFHLYQPDSNGRSLYGFTSGYYWEDIGHYNDTHYLKMDVRYEPQWTSSCDTPDSCQCEFPKYQPSRYMKQPSPNDLNIVFVSDIHQADSNNQMGCGAIDTASNMQNLFAFLYAIKNVNDNKDSRFPGSLKLGGVALDTCSQTARIGQDVYSLLSGEPVCGEDNGQQVVPPASIVGFMVRNSQNSIAVSSMLSPLKVTSLSMSATSVDLSDKIEHGYFLRTVPPDNIQALVVAQILQKFGWDYVSVVYADNTYGRSAMDTLLGMTNRDSPSYCFGRTVAMGLNSSLDDAKGVIDQLNQQIGARVVVTFVTSDQVRLLLKATKRRGLNSRFIWIGSDTWANNVELTEGYEETAAGALTIQIRSEYSTGFREFVKSFTLEDHKGIPKDWFEEIYQTQFKCRILTSQVQKTYTRICSGEERFTDSMIPQDPYVLHTIMAVYQFAHGLSDIDACKSVGLSISSCLSLQENRKQLIYNGILNAQHEVLPDDLNDKSFNFKFTADGYGDIGYNIYNYRRNLTSGQYEYIMFGSSSAGDLNLDTRNYKSYSLTDRVLPLSRCPIGSTCQCLLDLSGTSVTFSRQDSGYIVTEEGQYVDPTTGQLVTIDDTPEMADRFRDIWAIIVATLAAIGAFAALCMFIYLLVVYPVRGGTTILGYMLCFGIVLLYVLVFAFIVHPSAELCGLRRFALGFVYSICYAALFVKLVDCWRTKDKEDIYMVKYNKIGNPWGLFFSACLLVLVQVMINAEWLILEEPDMTRVIYNNKLWPRCVPDDFYDEGLILSCVYVMFLVFISMIVGLAAFGNDKNHWDCRWNVGCVVLTIPCWMVWCLVASLGEYKMRDAAVAIGLLYNATVMLLCGPLRKLYLLNKYQARLDEEERKSQIMSSQRDYNSMYGRQYDNMPRMQDGDSVRGSTMMDNDEVFMYEPKS